MRYKFVFCIAITFLTFIVNGCGSLYDYNLYSSNDSTQYSKDLFGIVNKNSSQTVFYNNTGKVLEVKNSVFGKSETGEFIVIGIDEIKKITTSENKQISPSELTTELISKLELLDGTLYSFDSNYGSLITDKKMVIGYNQTKEPIAIALDDVDNLQIEEVNAAGKFFEFGVVFAGLLGVALIAMLFTLGATANVTFGG